MPTAKMQQLRRDASTGTPTSLLPGQVFDNSMDKITYIGRGTNSSTGNAQTIEAIGGVGFFVDKSSGQTIAGLKTFSTSPVVPTPASTDNSTNAASTAFVQNYIGTQKGAASGLASLQADGTLTPTQIPGALKGAMVYQGVSDASTNTPSLTSGQGTKGYVYKVNKAGTTTLDGHSSWTIGDSAVFNGNTWDKWDGADVEVLSVNGQTGAVVLTSDNINEGATNLYFQASRVLNTVATGLSSATAAAISASDTILGALGKLQAQVNARLVIGNNLSDLNNIATARTNLGLGTMAVQNASAVAISGGVVDGVTIDAGLV